MSKRRLSVSSEDTEDETTMMLRTQGISNERIEKFKAKVKRIGTRRAIKASPFGDFCSMCGVVTIEDIRAGFRISDGFERLRASSKDCRLCHLVLMSLRNRLPKIDAKLENHGPTTSAVAVKFRDDGATDLDSINAASFRLDTVPQVSLFEMLKLSMGNEADGVIRIEARVSQETTGHQEGRRLLRINSLIRIYTKDAEISRTFCLPLDPRLKADHKFHLMRRWLEAEITASERCLMPISLSSGIDQSDTFPCRLIYVPLSFAIEPCRLRLVNSEELLENEKQRGRKSYPPYVTLSHRWGSTHHFTTTEANLHSRQSGFTLQDLPRTY